MIIEEVFRSTSGFEWDRGNIEKIWNKHDVRPDEAEEVFFNKPVLMLPDTIHSTYEERFHTMGKTDSGRQLFITWTVRNFKVRVISARPMSRKERGMYEQQF